MFSEEAQTLTLPSPERPCCWSECHQTQAFSDCHVFKLPPTGIQITAPISSVEIWHYSESTISFHTHTYTHTPPKHIMRQSHLLLNPHWVYLWSVRPRCAIFGSRSFNLFPWFGDNNNNCAVGAALKLADTSSGVIAQPSHPKVPLFCSHAFTSSSFAVHWHKGCRSSSSFSFPFFQLIQIRCLKTNLVWIVMLQRRVYNLLIQRHNRKRSGSEFKMN